MPTDTRVHHTDVVLDEIRNDPSGRDSKHLNEEYVTLKNAGEAEVSISEWCVRNEAGDEFRFPEHTVLQPGEHVTLHTGSGTDTETDFYWESETPRWNNLEDTVTVLDRDGTVRIREPYNQ